MNSSRDPRNAAASVHQRLVNRARQERVDFGLLLQRYAIERFLYRLGQSAEANRFTLKGAALFWVWAVQPFRPTRDVDLLGAGSADPGAIRRAIEAICSVSCPEDGATFDARSIRIEDIRAAQEYGGVRVLLKGFLGSTRLALQVDIGFGDAVTPAPEQREYPTLLDHPVPRLWVYPRETFVAEKFEAMVRLGAISSRVKDLWDVTVVARRFAFKGRVLREAVAATFRCRGTPIGDPRPEVLLPAFYEDAKRVQYWQQFQRQVEAGGHGPVQLARAGDEIRAFLGPVWDSLLQGGPFDQPWPAGGPWQARARRGGRTDRVSEPVERRQGAGKPRSLKTSGAGAGT